MLNEISRTAFVSLANVQGLGPPPIYRILVTTPGCSLHDSKYPIT